MSKWIEPLAGLLALLCAACGPKPPVISTPVEVKVPVAQSCSPLVPPKPARPALAIRQIGATTPIDKDVDDWRATSLSLLGYIAALETAVSSRDAALDACRGH